MQQTFDSPHPTPGSALNRSSDLSFKIDHRDRSIRLTVAGEIDIATADSLTDVALRALRRPARVLLLDLSGVSFCGAAGIRSLLEIHHAARDARINLVLTCIQPHVRRVLDIVGTSAVIPIADPARPCTRMTAGPAQCSNKEHQRLTPDRSTHGGSRPFDLELPDVDRPCLMAFRHATPLPS